MKNFWIKKANNKRGFTLVELIVVIAILVILAAILIPVVGGYIQQAQDATGNANARTVYSGACAYVAQQLAAGATVAASIGNTELGTFLGANFRGVATATIANNAVTVVTWTEAATGAVVYTYTAATGAFTNSRT